MYVADGASTLSITTLTMATYGITTLSIATFSITTLSVKGVFVANRLNVLASQHNKTVIMLSVASYLLLCCVIML